MNVKIDEVKTDIENLKFTMLTNHTEVKQMLNDHCRTCSENMEKHIIKINALEEHKNTVNGFFVAIGFILTILGGYLIFIK